MGEAKRRRERGLGPRHPKKPMQELTFEEALTLTRRDAMTCWAWLPRTDRGRVIGATTFLSYRDDEDEGDGEAWVRVEGDDWHDPQMGEEDDLPMLEIDEEVKRRPWFATPDIDRLELPEFSFLKLRALGCTDPDVLTAARAFDSRR